MDVATYTRLDNLPYVTDDTAGERFEKLMREKGFGLRSLARRAGVSHGTIQNMVRQGLAGSKMTTVEKVAEALGVSVVNMKRVDNGLLPIPESALAEASRYQVHPDWIQLPVYGAVSAGDLEAEPIEDEVAFVPLEHLERHGADPDTVRTYVVNGRCMLSPEALRTERSFAPRDYVVVDLDKQPEVGDTVVAWWEEQGVMIIKRFGLEEGGIVLSPIAPGHPNVTLPEDADVAVLGPVIWRGGYG